MQLIVAVRPSWSFSLSSWAQFWVLPYPANCRFHSSTCTSIYEIRECPSRMHHWSALLTAQFAAEIPWNILGSSILFVLVLDSWLPLSCAGYMFLMMGVIFPSILHVPQSGCCVCCAQRWACCNLVQFLVSLLSWSCEFFYLQLWVFDLTQFGSQQLSVEEADVPPHSCGLNTYKRYTYHVVPSLLTVFVHIRLPSPTKLYML